MALFDDEPVKKSDAPEPRLLERLSIEELKEYIAWLEGEIERVRADISRKTKATGLADQLFKSNANH